ncbi:MAG: UDP-N-acetylmuramoyl-tripeptide--D-alanyl-D-alanine ligase [Armatimonadetes bacterium]|nr:UDP-N-acetylmuramoyl-tripeptide--D-alanyl-D-alanine ligase [Armatimonadota bacterium]
MQTIKAEEVLQACHGELLAGELDTKITGVSTDTRTLEAGDLFVALTGESSDGHKFLADALSKGASGVVVSKKVEARRLAIRVEDTLIALGDLAAYYRGKFQPVVIGVTGSVGKTTTREMIAAVVAARGPVLKSAGNFNNEIGVPLTLFQLNPRHKTAVIEMAMRGPGQIEYLAKIARPSVGVITNIHMSHIELLGSLDAIADTKGELLDYLPDDGAAILNADDAYFDYFKRRSNARVISFGESPQADIRAVSAGLDSKGCCTFKVETPRGAFDVRIPVPGEHNIKDALAAIAVGEVLEIAHDHTQEVLANFKPPEKRSNVVPTRQGFVVIDDTYNASPPSVQSALKTLKMIEGGRKIAVLGDMLELGEHALDAHLEIGRAVKEAGVDMLVVVGQLAKLIARGAIDAGMPVSLVQEFDDSWRAAKELPEKLLERDVVLVKGSRAMKMERVVEALIAA